MNRTVGFVVGRFQVPRLHEGHHLLLKTAEESCDRIVVFVGVHPFQYTAQNPLTFDQVREVYI